VDLRIGGENVVLAVETIFTAGSSHGLVVKMVQYISLSLSSYPTPFLQPFLTKLIKISTLF
jgi:hypothetical protein